MQKKEVNGVEKAVSCEAFQKNDVNVIEETDEPNEPYQLCHLCHRRLVTYS